MTAGTTIARSPAMATAQAHAHLLELLRGFDTAMLVTRSAQGALRARPMVIAEVKEAGEISFVTDVNTPKVDEMFADSHVAVILMASDTFVAITGLAEVERNPAKVQELWKESWRLWFDDHENSDLVLVRVSGLRAEYWDHSSLTAAKSAFRTAQAFLSGQEPEREPEDETHARLTLAPD